MGVSMGVVTKTCSHPLPIIWIHRQGQILDPLGQILDLLGQAGADSGSTCQAGANSGSTRPGRGRSWIHSARQGQNCHQNFLMEFLVLYLSKFFPHTPSLLWLKSLYLPPYFHRASYAPVRVGCHCLCRSIAIQYIVSTVSLLSSRPVCRGGEFGGLGRTPLLSCTIFIWYICKPHPFRTLLW